MSFWLPPENLLNNSPLVDLRTIHDFDQVQGFYPGDQARSQLSAGKFSGKLLSTYLGGIQYAIDHGNQNVELQANSPKELFSFSFVVDQQHPIVTYGVEREMGTVLVTPPNATVHTISSANAALGVVFVSAGKLLATDGLIPEAADWLASLENRGEFVQSPWLANRLRFDIRHIMECALSTEASQLQSALRDSAYICLATALSFDFISRRDQSILKRSPSFEKFWMMRETLLKENGSEPQNPRALARDASSSRRTVENTFSRNVGLGPTQYFQVLRLNRTRKKLLDRSRLKDSIGDIASEEGFWDWSRFSNYYLRHFGERPSETRMKVTG